jgi:hypothetical protein
MFGMGVPTNDRASEPEEEEEKGREHAEEHAENMRSRTCAGQLGSWAVFSKGSVLILNSKRKKLRQSTVWGSFSSEIY